MCYIYTKMLYLHIVSLDCVERVLMDIFCCQSAFIAQYFWCFFIDSQPNGDVLSVFRSYNNNNSGFI